MTATPDTLPGSRSLRLRQLLPAGVGVLGLGMAITISGIVMPSLFHPGTWIVAVGLTVLAVAGILGTVEARGDS